MKKRKVSKKMIQVQSKTHGNNPGAKDMSVGHSKKNNLVFNHGKGIGMVG